MLVEADAQEVVSSRGEMQIAVWATLSIQPVSTVESQTQRLDLECRPLEVTMRSMRLGRSPDCNFTRTLASIELCYRTSSLE